ncbi:MAG: Mic19 family protein [Asgard group archaeon]|nr:Mic19 family protein [Asgard group archaeon]
MEKETIKNFKNTTENALLKEDKENTKLSVAAANEKITKLTDLLKQNAILGKVAVPPNVQEARELVLKCLKENEGRSLNCWDEVETFKQLVKEL